MLQNKEPTQLQDSFGRVIDYIRISVTDRCNLRCVYCMPTEGVPPMAHKDIISYEEIVRIVRVLANSGLKKVKLTGGEPLVRPGLNRLVAMLYAIPGIEDVTLTTNGLLLDKQIEGLYQAGIRSINVSVDAATLGIQRQITRGDQFLHIEKLTHRLLQYPQLQLKLNVVPIKGINQTELPKLALLAKENDIAVRYIELMPIGLGKTMEFLAEEDIKRILLPVTGELHPTTEKWGHGPCSYYTADGFKGRIGFISAVSHKFCDSCNRVRITAKGYFKTCLQYDVGVHLLEHLRKGAEDNEILRLIEDALEKKPKEHLFGGGVLVDGEEKTMSQIGG